MVVEFALVLIAAAIVSGLQHLHRDGLRRER
jgi:hypothetical protein